MTEKRILNTLPAPTFGWLGVNSLEREVLVPERAESLESKGVYHHVYER